jgi:hypothetical protein
LQFPKSVLTKTRSGRLEVRGLDSKGRYVMYRYLNSETGRMADRKRKLCLMDGDGNVQEFFIIPLKTSSRSLLIAAEKGEMERKVWNPKTGSEEELWK